MSPTSIFGRDTEIDQIRQLVDRKQSFLLYGSSGVGKTSLLKHLAGERSELLYCSESSSSQVVFRNLAMQLLAKNNRFLVAACGRDRQDQITGKSAVALRGIVSNALRDTSYWIVIDHVQSPSQSFAAAIRELMARTEVRLAAAARSEHMEDVGFLLPIFSDRSAKYALRNFDSEKAREFAEDVAHKVKLEAANQAEVIGKIVSYSKGNPGAIMAMLQMAVSPKYLSRQHVKLSPLYIDFRLSWDTTHG